VLYTLGKAANSDTAKNIAKAVVPTIALAEISSCCAVARRDRLDVALFQRGGLGEPGAGGFWPGEAHAAALPRAGAVGAGDAAAGCGEGTEFLKA
jgi:hypothetical protein